MKDLRYTKIPFPVYAHIPGKTIHPNKKGGHSYGKKEPKCLGLQENFWNNECFLFGVDLFNYYYYWESHVYWEAVWHKSKHLKVYDCFLKAIIKVAAGRLKKHMGQISVAHDLWQKSRALLGENGEMIPQELGHNIKEWENFFLSLPKDRLERIPIEMPKTL